MQLNDISGLLMKQKINKKVLFTPGPSNISTGVKESMLMDIGSHDVQIVEIIRNIRHHLLNIGKFNHLDYTTILLQGSGTFMLEATLLSTSKPDDKYLVISNGTYGDRLAKLCVTNKLKHQIISFDYAAPTPCDQIEQACADKTITHLAFVHCETSTGRLNEIKKLCYLAKQFNKKIFIDAMSTFAGYDIDFGKLHVDILVSSSNKCLQSVPGIGIAIVKKELLNQNQHIPMALNLYEQYYHLQQHGKFRFTSPTHALLALDAAIQELETRGGTTAREKRYQESYRFIADAFSDLGITPLIDYSLHGHTISSFYYPIDDRNRFHQFFYNNGLLVYHGCLNNAKYFRIGHIGEIGPEENQALVKCMQSLIA